MSRLFSILALVLTIVAAQASTGEPISTLDKSVVVSFTSWKGDAVDLYIIDTYGTIVHSDRITALDSKKEYDLSLLPTGDYIIRTSNDLRQEEQSISISTTTVTTVSSPEVTYKPVLHATTDYVDVNYFNGDRPADVMISNSRGQEIYRKINKGRNLNKRYDLSSLRAGTYTISVSNGKTTSSTTVSR